VIPVPERAVQDIHIGQTIAIEVSGAQQKFDGKIVRFSDQIDTQTRTMHTEVQVPNRAYQLVPGMYASVKIPLSSRANVLAVPIQALREGSEETGSVLVVDSSNHIERRAVKVGLQSASYVEILSGLAENDLVIFGEQGQYKSGELVNPKIIEPGKAE
jgi:RND family efflux transporter MFP subunit